MTMSTQIRLPDRAGERLKFLARRDHRSLNSMLVHAVLQWLQEHDPEWKEDDDPELAEAQP
jgi:predicted transcriptional regulator